MLLCWFFCHVSWSIYIFTACSLVRWTDGRYQVHHLPASLSINIVKSQFTHSKKQILDWASFSTCINVWTKYLFPSRCKNYFYWQVTFLHRWNVFYIFESIAIYYYLHPNQNIYLEQKPLSTCSFSQVVLNWATRGHLRASYLFVLTQSMLLWLMISNFWK